MEKDYTYFARRALEENAAAGKAKSPRAQRAHFELAMLFQHRADEAIATAR